MSGLDELVPIPPQGTFNLGLSSCREDTMLGIFGKPGDLTEKCSKPTGLVAKRFKYSVDVGPFRVFGLDYAVASLAQVFAAAKNVCPDVLSELKTAGMLCVRKIKHNPSHYSNHSWGCAIDLYFGSGVVPQGSTLTQRGFLSLYQVFNQYGWYWGAGFSGGAVDGMHFELSDEAVKNIPDSLNSDALVAAADYISDMGYDLDLEDA